MKRITKQVYNDSQNSDLDCQDLVKCVFNLNELEFSTYCTLLAMKKGTASELQVKIDRLDKTMINRALKKLHDKGLVERDVITGNSNGDEQETSKNRPSPKRGYYYIYYPMNLENMKEEIEVRLSNWYEKALGELENMEQKFSSLHNEKAESKA